MSVTVSLDQIQVPPGQMAQIQDLSWSEFESLLRQRGDDGPGRIRYSNGVLTIMSPSPEHEFSIRTIDGLLRIVLEEEGIPAFLMGSTTLKGKPVGVEPDSCYYIDSAAAIRAVLVSGQNRIDLETDPPPDLVLEIDVSSLTDVQAYLPLKIPEVWIYRPARQQLDVYCLEKGDYAVQEQSRSFSRIDIRTVIPEWVERARNRDPITMGVEFRRWVQQQLQNRDEA